MTTVSLLAFALLWETRRPALAALCRHRGVLACLIGLAAVALMPQKAEAETSNAALKAIGLLGTWSPDCAAQPTAAAWMTFSVPILGAPTVEGYTFASHTVSEVLSAQRITEEKIAITTQITKYEPLHGAQAQNVIGRKSQYLWIKSDDHFKIWEANVVGGNTFVHDGIQDFGVPSSKVASPPYEHCLNK